MNVQVTLNLEGFGQQNEKYLVRVLVNGNGNGSGNGNSYDNGNDYSSYFEQIKEYLEIRCLS